MGSLFDSVFADGASPMLDQHHGETVSITRGPNTTASVTASWDTQADETATTDDKHTKMVDRFWFVKQSTYQIASTAVEPRTRDRLTDDAGQVWEVLPAKGTPPVVSYAGGDYWKIATKQVT
jgi:hypothetical protein